MALDRLFIYDPEDNEAKFLAKGYSTGWSIETDDPAAYVKSLSTWLEERMEFRGGLSTEAQVTRLELRSEGQLRDVNITW